MVTSCAERLREKSRNSLVIVINSMSYFQEFLSGGKRNRHILPYRKAK